MNESWLHVLQMSDSPWIKVQMSQCHVGLMATSAEC